MDNKYLKSKIVKNKREQVLGIGSIGGGHSWHAVNPGFELRHSTSVEVCSHNPSTWRIRGSSSFLVTNNESFYPIISHIFNNIF